MLELSYFCFGIAYFGFHFLLIERQHPVKKRPCFSLNFRGKNYQRWVEIEHFSFKHAIWWESLLNKLINTVELFCFHSKKFREYDLNTGVVTLCYKYADISKRETYHIFSRNILRQSFDVILSDTKK